MSVDLRVMNYALCIMNYDILAYHQPTVVEQVSLHEGCHLAPPEGRDNNDRFVITQRGDYRVDGRITARVVGISLEITLSSWVPRA